MFVCVGRVGLILTREKEEEEGVKGGAGSCWGSWGMEMTNAETALSSARRHKGQPEGGYLREPAGGILAHAQRGTLSRPHPAWNLLFSRILPDLHPPSYSRRLPPYSAHQQTPNEPASRKQTPSSTCLLPAPT